MNQASREIQIESGDGAFSGYVATPAAEAWRDIETFLEAELG